MTATIEPLASQEATSAQGLPVFQTSALPPWACRFAEELAASMQVPTDLTAMLVLAALSAASCGAVVVEVRPGWREPTNLYVLVVLASAERKSPAFREVTHPLFDLEERLLEEAKDHIALVQAQAEAADARVDQAKKALAKAKAGEERMLAEAELATAVAERQASIVPPLPLVIVDDATPEALTRKMAAGGGVAALLSAEGGVFARMAGKYSDAKRAANDLAEVWLKAYSGDPLKVDRIGRPPEAIRHPRLTIGVTTQPDVLSGLVHQPGFKERGLLARFAYAVPPPRVGHRLTGSDVPPLSHEARQGWQDGIEALAVRCLKRDEAWLLRLSPDAVRTHARLEAATELDLCLPDGRLVSIAEWGGKYVGHVTRIAGLLHAAVPGASGVISGEEMDAAIAIGEYLIAHALEAHDVMGTVGDRREKELSDAVATVVSFGRQRGTEGFTRRALQKARWRQFPNAERAQDALDEAEARGLVARSKAAQPGGGHPIEVYSLADGATP